MSIAECSISVVITVPVTAIITAIITIIIMYLLCIKHNKKILSTELEMMNNAAYGQVIPAEFHTVYETPYI